MSKSTYRIFPSSRDLLHLESVAKKHDVELIIGGEPLRVCEMNGFGRERHPTDWVVAYIAGDHVNLTNMQAEWSVWLTETIDQFDAMLLEEREKKSAEIFEQMSSGNRTVRTAPCP